MADCYFIFIGSLAGGMNKEDVMQEYELTQAQVEAALAYESRRALSRLIRRRS